MFASAEHEIVSAIAARAYKDIAEKEDRQMAREIEIGQDNKVLHKAFDAKGYRKAIQSLTKKQLIDALVREAELRHSGDCNIYDYRQGSDDQLRKITNLTADLTKWRTAARRMAEALSSLVNL
jgi:hypothetical protein